MAWNYDRAAPFYDRLAKLVLGTTPVAVPTWLCRHIPARSRVLIVGGGTGWILEEIADVHAAGLDIVYIEASARMMAQAMKRECGSNQVTFVTGKVEDTPLTGTFDVVTTPFLFDNFTNSTAATVFVHICRNLAPGGLWLYCDFCNTKQLKHRLLLGSMYLFFRAWSGVEATQLPDVERLFAEVGFEVRERKMWMNGFVEGVVWQYSNH